MKRSKQQVSLYMGWQSSSYKLDKNYQARYYKIHQENLKAHTFLFCNVHCLIFQNIADNFENDLDRHPCVKVTLVHADQKNQAGLMHVLAPLNK